MAEPFADQLKTHTKFCSLNISDGFSKGMCAIIAFKEKWVHFFGPVNGKTKVDSFIGYAAHLGLIRGGTPSGLYC